MTFAIVVLSHGELLIAGTLIIGFILLALSQSRIHARAKENAAKLITLNAEVQNNRARMYAVSDDLHKYIGTLVIHDQADLPSK